MLCRELQQFHRIGSGHHPRSFSMRALEIGARMNEYNVNPLCRISDYSLNALHDGKEDYMLNNDQRETLLAGAYAIGYAQEKRDLFSMLAWASDLQKCKDDRRMGRVQ